MKLMTATTLAALLAGSIGLATLVPANADDATPSTSTAAPATPAPTTGAGNAGHMNWSKSGPGGRTGHPGWARRGAGDQAHGRGQSGRMGRMPGNMLDFACSPGAGEALEIALVRTKYQVVPDAQQQPLFDALQTAAISAQASFAESCKTAMTNGAAPGKATMLDRLQGELAMDNAKVTALNTVVPKFKAFYDSLTDQQKARLEPHRQGWNRMGGMGHGNYRHGPGAMQPRTPQSGTDSSPAPAAPTDSTTTTQG